MYVLDDYYIIKKNSMVMVFIVNQLHLCTPCWFSNFPMHFRCVVENSIPEKEVEGTDSPRGGYRDRFQNESVFPCGK